MTKSKARKFTVEFKKAVVRNYYESGLSKTLITDKWGLYNISILNRWLKDFPVDEKLVTLRQETINQMEKAQNESPEALAKRIKELESELAYQKLRAHAFEKMIEIAEQEEGISILKKGGAKQ